MACSHRTAFHYDIALGGKAQILNRRRSRWYSFLRYRPPYVLAGKHATNLGAQAFQNRHDPLEDERAFYVMSMPTLLNVTNILLSYSGFP
jgi:hypothetical protein